MHYVVLRLREVRLAAVLVEKWQIGDRHADHLIGQLQLQLQVPVMLVARDDSAWNGVRARAQFDPAQYLFALLAMDEIEWAELPAVEPELPF